MPCDSRARKGQTRTKNPTSPLIETLGSGDCSKRLLCSGAYGGIGKKKRLALNRSRQARFRLPSLPAIVARGEFAQDSRNLRLLGPAGSHRYHQGIETVVGVFDCDTVQVQEHQG